MQGKRKFFVTKKKDTEKEQPVEPSASSSSSSTDQSQWSVNGDALSAVTLGMLTWDTFSSTEKEMTQAKFKQSDSV